MITKEFKFKLKWNIGRYFEGKITNNNNKSLTWAESILKSSKALNDVDFLVIIIIEVANLIPK